MIDVLCLEGKNASGKTYQLKKSIIPWLEINSYVYFLKLSSMKKTVAEILWILKVSNFYVLTNNIYSTQCGDEIFGKYMDQLSSGQKKKIYLSALIGSNSYIWYLDEPSNYLDSSSYEVLEQSITHKINSGSSVIITTVFRDETLKKKMSLSRFELLTTRLSSKCSTTEL